MSYFTRVSTCFSPLYSLSYIIHNKIKIYSILLKAFTHLCRCVRLVNGLPIEPKPDLTNWQSLQETKRTECYNETLHKGSLFWQCCWRCVLQDQLTCLSQYAFMSLLSGVCLLILNWTTDPSWPATLRLTWSFSVFTPSCSTTEQQTDIRTGL